MAQEDDYIAETERTIIMPRPGGRRTGAAASESTPVTAATARPTASSFVASFLAPANIGDNPLVSNAALLLSMIPVLSSQPYHTDVAALQARIVEEIKRYEQAAHNAGASKDEVFTARYLLCCVLDETVLSTPWGGESAWSKQSLLITFHNETWGGEKFFLILDRLQQDPSRHFNLLELIYLCLSLGFEGKYRVLEGGRAKVADRREQLYLRLKQLRGEFAPELAGHWQPSKITMKRKQDGLSPWLIGVGTLVLLLVTYFSFSLLLGNASKPVSEQLLSIEQSMPAL